MTKTPPSRKRRIVEFLLSHYVLYVCILRPAYLLRRKVSAIRG